MILTLILFAAYPVADLDRLTPEAARGLADVTRAVTFVPAGP
jgi:hypothetical protein